MKLGDTRGEPCDEEEESMEQERLVSKPESTEFFRSTGLMLLQVLPVLVLRLVREGELKLILWMLALRLCVNPRAFMYSDLDFLASLLLATGVVEVSGAIVLGLATGVSGDSLE